MVPCVALDADLGYDLSHTKYKVPAISREQISIGQDQQALVLFEVDSLVEVVEYISNMELLDTLTFPRIHKLLLLKFLQTE